MVGYDHIRLAQQRAKLALDVEPFRFVLIFGLDVATRVIVEVAIGYAKATATPVLVEEKVGWSISGHNLAEVAAVVQHVLFI